MGEDHLHLLGNGNAVTYICMAYTTDPDNYTDL